MDIITENLQVSTAYLDKLREQLRRDSVCARMMQLCEDGWPAQSNSEPALKRALQAFLTVQVGLLLKGTRLIILSTMRNDVRAELHEGRQGMVKCRECAQQTVWWPGLSQQLDELVLNAKHAA
ncbi:hypothetical protein N1851_009577 [Merluccius polli]|uniref:Uncharacterized protein n=1 Tax=Merluccius polli TaxID=89951 RepID=A0AA47P3V4_MERPO|nr:hypothetical protein N1851_009577 [Merluccius polli]